MKIILILALTCTSVFAKTVSQRKVDDLEKRVEALERRVAALEGGKKPAGLNLKTKDLKNKKAASKSNFGRAAASSNQEGMSSKQRADVMKQLEAIKKSKSEQQKVLDELLNHEP